MIVVPDGAKTEKPAAVDQKAKGPFLLIQKQEATLNMRNDNQDDSTLNEFDIAVIGMAGQFPGANNIDEYWHNLANDIESISFFTDEELRRAGVDEAALNDPNYIKAAPILKRDPAQFDAAFFGYSPREAQFMDPQHRLFLECAWTALEYAGYDAQACDVPVGVFGGAAMNTYFMYSGLIGNFATEYLPTLIGNDNSFLATRVSYKLNLRGPSVTVQTACSTALVAVHQACQSLLNEECDMSIAGGVSVRVPHQAGYFYEEGSVATPDGHCRPFDAAAQGTIFGSGVGIVVLKRLRDAVEDGDTIHAVIKGSAINNDGSSKIDYTAPSVTSQSEVIIEAMSAADVTADSISYIEAHGTGTFLGDPIEIAALTKAFDMENDFKTRCAIGSVKGNIGHLDAAAGIAGLIKTILALKKRQIPATLHYQTPNPQIAFGNTRFYVNSELRHWDSRDDQPRRAGVTSLGIGGTNAHLIIEEAPDLDSGSQSRPFQLLPLSARTETALNTAVSNLVHHLQHHPQQSLADVAFTLQTGRKQFKHRRIVVAQDQEEAVRELIKAPLRSLTAVQDPGQREIIFMFSGQGAQYVQMGRDLYQNELLFRQEVDACAEILKHHLDRDIRHVLYPADDTAAQLLTQTAYTQPALFVIEYALARLWQAWGIEPDGMVGHSIGEYVAACLAGVFSLEDALALVAKRGQLMQSMPSGSMLAVLLPEPEVAPYLNGRLSLAVVNGDAVCVVAGEDEAVLILAETLDKKAVKTRRLQTSHAFHSHMMAPILAEFTQFVAQLRPQPPQRPFVSNVTGSWIHPAEAADPAYWATHLRQTVRFHTCLETLLAESDRVFIEVGPGHTLTKLVQSHPDKNKSHAVINSLRHPKETIRDDAHMSRSLGQAWLAGLPIDWAAYYAAEHRRRVPLPTYPFERQRHWYQAKDAAQSETIRRRTDMADWFYIPTWQRLPGILTAVSQPQTWLLFADSGGILKKLAATLGQQGNKVVVVTPGAEFTQASDATFSINLQHPSDYIQLFDTLAEQSLLPDQIIHGWNLDTGQAARPPSFYSLYYLAQAITRQLSTSAQLLVVGSELADVLGGDPVAARKGMLSGAVRSLAEELDIPVRLLDLPSSGPTAQLADQILTETTGKPFEPFVAYRGGHRWVQTFAPLILPPPQSNGGLKQKGTYLITGGFGGVGAEIGRSLAQSVQANLILLSRSELPLRSQWTDVVAQQPDSKLSRRIQLVQELEAAGAVVLPLAADVSQRPQMQAALAQVKAAFGQINGIFHAAGLVHEGLLAVKEAATAVDVLRPKVDGTRILFDETAAYPPDFMVLFSSIGAVTAVPGLVDYGAANAFMDTFAQRHHGGSPHLVAINWPAWQGGGMVAQMTNGQARQEAFAKGIAPQEGFEAMLRILEARLPQVIVSPVAFAQKPRPPAQTAAVNSIPDPIVLATQSATEATGLYKNETEQRLAQLWETFLGVERPLPEDDYFELGGSSLIALRLIKKIEQDFGVKLRLNSLLDAPTLREMANLLQ